jgi:hypothetical protein
MKSTFRRLAIAAGAALAMAGPARAYIDYVPMMSVGTWNNNSNVYMSEWRKHIGQPEKAVATPAKAALTTSAGLSPTVVPTRGASNVPAQLAANYPPDKRAETERAFRELLDGYRKIEQRFNIPANDLAGAVAAFVAGSWMAYRNSDFPDENFPALVSQMRQIIASNPEFLRASAAEKRDMYDQMVIRGLFLATVQMALKQKPNDAVAANMRQIAKGNLEQFLKTDAERVQVTAKGLSLN